MEQPESMTKDNPITTMHAYHLDIFASHSKSSFPEGVVKSWPLRSTYPILAHGPA